MFLCFWTAFHLPSVSVTEPYCRFLPHPLPHFAISRVTDISSCHRRRQFTLTRQNCRCPNKECTPQPGWELTRLDWLPCRAGALRTLAVPSAGSAFLLLGLTESPLTSCLRNYAHWEFCSEELKGPRREKDHTGRIPAQSVTGSCAPEQSLFLGAHP